ncbi:sensor histidine kinase [Demequina sp. NBRC 110055]|uniref:sensor histidine kinase n=1 Tax=Demequina sp. NBRC 110055 TaxID=1570344 RepID=UPI000A028DBF|nr:ATP-binding protein [Demequina sp. NBRC 110055]
MTTAPAPRVARPLQRRRNAPAIWRGLGGLALLVIAGVLAFDRWGGEDLPGWLIPLVLFLLSLGLTWSPLDGAFGQDAWRLDVSGLFRRDDLWRLVVGVTLGITALWWFALWDYTDRMWVRSIVTTVVVILGLGLMLAPWWLRAIRQVSIERQARIREHERAEIAAHLHDSVLQTLTLIRSRATDPDAVARLARAQERDLRAYLYGERRDPDASVATAIAEAIGEVEDAHSVVIDTVSVGDAPLTPDLRAAVAATREAAKNAARHATGPISVYAELTAKAFEVFVRDAGPGFDPGAIPDDRLGIRQSIMGRVERHGGHAEIHSSPGARTEVAIVVPRRES